MKKFPFARESALQHAQTEIEEVRCEVNADLMEELVEREISGGGQFWMRRRAYERGRQDPDDVYIDVQRREDERKKLGLPPRIVVVAYSAGGTTKQTLGKKKNEK
jgi:hypothetical protein